MQRFFQVAGYPHRGEAPGDTPADMFCPLGSRLVVPLPGRVRLEECQDVVIHGFPVKRFEVHLTDTALSENRCVLAE